MPKPFIKYCGGKTKLLKYLTLPDSYNNYFEPFVGGGSVFLNFYEYNHERHYNVSDINESLINCYNVIKTRLEALILELKNEHYKNLKTVYLENRKRFNMLKKEPFKDNEIERAALFIYLNKCGFNGMYRENKKGEFNIPFGRMKNPDICNEKLLKDICAILQNVNIESCDYTAILDKVRANDFVYMDPPYDNTFTSYTKDVFVKEHQIQLKNFVDVLTEKKVHVLLSNSNTEFIKSLYTDYNITYLETRYSIGGKNASRNIKNEVLISNY
jgi:DNA adenine methylase